MTLERIEHKVFASEAPLEEMGQFGSALATTKFNTKNVVEIQALPAYTQGWGSAIISENNYPAMEEMNGVLNVMSYHTGYLYQEGIPVYSSTQTYSATSMVKSLDGKSIYRSLKGENKGNSLEDGTSWELFDFSKGALKTNQITNCLLEVPQNIKLELNNGTLTLKAGSKVIVPNGAGVFDEVEITSDKTHTQSANGDITVYYYPTQDRMVSYYSSADASGTDVGSNSKTFYDTDDNKVSRYDGGTLTLTGLSFPLARITVTNGAISTIDQVFNGFGYIGSTIWVDKGVKGLIPNGRNEDGSLKNIEFTTSKVLKASAQNNLQHIRLNASELQIGILYYNEAENVNTNTNGVLRNFAVVGNVTGDSNNVITSFQPKQPFRATDYNDVNNKVSKSGDTMTGNLHIKNGDVHVGFLNNAVTTSTNPSSYTNLGNLFVYDKDGQITGYFQNAIDANAVSMSMGARRKISGADKTASWSLSVDTAGNSYFNFPMCTTKATTTSSARSNRVAVVVENYVNGASWYRVWSDGWIEQGGQCFNTETDTRYMNLTFLKAFANTNYCITLGGLSATLNNTDYAHIYSATKNGVRLASAAGSIPINWYACGY